MRRTRSLTSSSATRLERRRYSQMSPRVTSKTTKNGAQVYTLTSESLAPSSRSGHDAGCVRHSIRRIQSHSKRSSDHSSHHRASSNDDCQTWGRSPGGLSFSLSCCAFRSSPRGSQMRRTLTQMVSSVLTQSITSPWKLYFTILDIVGPYLPPSQPQPSVPVLRGWTLARACHSSSVRHASG